jgi:hypothetical protein
MIASQLRAKEGSPGTRETVAFSGIEITLVYGADGRVSRMELPGVGPDGTRERVDGVLLQLVPISSRGKEIGTNYKVIGSFSVGTMIYENVFVVERHVPERRIDVGISFIENHQSSSTS